MSDALVLAGALVKGAFTAGALSVLSEPETKSRIGLDVARIVGTSSGGLNGTYYAAAIRSGDEAAAARRLVQLWLEDATLFGTFDLNLRDIAGTLGLSTESKIAEVLRKHIAPASGRNPIELRLVVTNADGEPIEVDGHDATTFEHVVDCPGADFDTVEGLELVFQAATASAALPGVFAPVALQVGDRTVRALDGGLVDNTPLGHALRGAPGIERVFVIAPFPRIRNEPPDLHGLELASHVFDVVVEERLVRDLRRVAEVNGVIARLAAVLPDPAQRAAVYEALGWAGRHPVQIVEIRPEGELPGDSFSGFVSRKLRQTYVQAGADAARRALAGLR